jgi:pimeloyl-ACP methyl ester carboxylesterase
MTVLRTPDERFDALPGWPWAPRYTQHGRWRVARVDEGPASGAPVALCLHGNPAWGYLYRHMIPVFLGAGLRVVAPDLIGFGRSDKPADESEHGFDFHRGMLLSLVEQLDLQDVMLVCQDWGGLLGLTLPMAAPERYTRLLVMNTTLATGELSEGFRAWRAYSNGQPDLAVGRLLRRGRPELTEAEAAGYDAPFPDAAYKAALRAFPNLVPEGSEAPGAALSREAQAFWRERWQGGSFMAVGERDPVLGPPAMAALAATIRGCPEPLRVPEGGHFVQEWGGPIARAALRHFGLAA